MFDEVDSDGNGYLDPGEMARLLRALFPQETVTDHEVRAFVAFLDGDGDGRVTLREIIECVRAVRTSDDTAAGGLTDTMARLARIVQDNRETAEDVFHRMDANKNGALDPPELMRMFDVLLPGATHVEKQQLLHDVLAALDLNGDAKLSLDELKRGLRLLNVVMLRPGDARFGGAG